MLTSYFIDPVTLAHYRTSPAGDYLDEFISWLENQGFRYRSLRRHVRGANTFSRWAQCPIEALDSQALAEFGKHLEERRHLQYASGPYNHNFVGARHFVRFLETTGRVAPPIVVETVEKTPVLWQEFQHWMHTQRGTTQATLNNYRLTILELLDTLGDQPQRFDASGLRHFILECAQHQGIERAKTSVTAVRMFVRFLIAVGQCSPGLDHAIPTVARWRLAALPKYLPAEDVERIIASCDPETLIGSRDQAVLLMLARLGLRAGDVAALLMTHIDWHDATLQVAGKNRRAERLPLSQEVGDAILHYLEQRPAIGDDHVFITTRVPFKGLSYQTVGQIATHAIKRAGVHASVHGSHILRHSAATGMLRQGVPLSAIGAVLRHDSIETTTTYAKVDTALLERVAQPWPEVRSC